MSIISENKFFVDGDIENGGISLSINNAGSGTNLFSVTTYGDFNYSATTYERTADYEGIYDASTTAFKVLEFTGAGGSGDITWQYALSNDNLTYTAFSSITSAIGDNSLEFDYRYIKLRYFFYSSYWTDSDYIEITKVENRFDRFVKGTIVNADQKNSNFQTIGRGDRLPRGGLSLLPTTGVYNLGDDIAKWNNLYCKSIVLDDDLTTPGSMIYLQQEVILSTTTNRVEISGLNSDIDGTYWINLYSNANTTTLFYLFLNGDSNSANYGYQQIFAQSTTSGASRDSTSTGISCLTNDSGTTTANHAYSQLIIYGQTGYKRNVLIKRIDGANLTNINIYRRYGYTWNSTETITSMVFVSAETMLSNTTFKIFSRRIQE